MYKISSSYPSGSLRMGLYRFQRKILWPGRSITCSVSLSNTCNFKFHIRLKFKLESTYYTVSVRRIHKKMVECMVAEDGHNTYSLTKLHPLISDASTLEACNFTSTLILQNRNVAMESLLTWRQKQARWQYLPGRTPLHEELYCYQRYIIFMNIFCNPEQRHKTSQSTEAFLSAAMSTLKLNRI